MKKKYAILRSIIDILPAFEGLKMGGLFTLWMDKGVFDTREQAEAELRKELSASKRVYFITEIYFTDRENTWT